jgi:uncharacterized membrane protein YfcA
MTTPQTLRCPFFQKAFGWCVPIGALGGLIGLGGGEFRLPVLLYAIGFDAKAAVPLNLMVTLVTLAFSLLVWSDHDSQLLGSALRGVTMLPSSEGRAKAEWARPVRREFRQ